MLVKWIQIVLILWNALIQNLNRNLRKEIKEKSFNRLNNLKNLDLHDNFLTETTKNHIFLSIKRNVNLVI